jgi:sugar (pentulose or hexulose) kinase
VGPVSARQDLVIGVDSSTTACKAIAWDRLGNLIAEGRASVETLSPEPTWYEHRAEDWWSALCQSLRSVVAQVGPERIAAMCITHQRETFVPVDENCQPLRNAPLWLDERARAEVAELDRRVGNQSIQQLTGKGPAKIQSLPKLLWLQHHEPDIVRRTYKFLDVHAFLVHHLTGRWLTSVASADPMGVVDMKRNAWAVELMRTLDLDPDRFVDLAPPGTVVGELTSLAAEATGLQAGLPIVAGAGDGQCAGLGANITGPGRVYLNLGTAMVSGAHTDQYVADPAFRTLCSPIAGAYITEEALGGGTFIVSWFVDRFAADLRNVNLTLSPEELLEAAASKVPPGSLGLMVVPYWNAVMPPYWDPHATGVTIGWTGAHRREHFYRAILEGIAFEERLATDAMQRATGNPINEFIVMGGGSRSALWCQIVADIVGKRVTRASTAEATTLGAGILAAAAAGWYPNVREAANAMTRTERSFEPNDATHAAYDRLFNEVYCGLFPAIKHSVDRLSELTYGEELNSA